LSLAVLLVVVLAGAAAFVAVPRLMQTGASGQQEGGSVPPGNYPKMGHAPDYSWVAGQVAFTRIQGGCTYIRTAADSSKSAAGQPEMGTPGEVRVGTAVSGDVSPPLRDITPAPAPPVVETPAEGDSFVPGGSGWDPSQVKDGDYVVVFGHPAGPGEPREICPGGHAYIVDRMQLNP
jgi:hypothetical protein